MHKTLWLISVFSVLVCTQIVAADAASWVLESSWGSRGTGPGELQDPRALAFGPNDHVYVADYANARVQQFDAGGNFIRQWGASGDPDVRFEYLRSIAVDNNGSVYVLDGRHIEKFTAEGQFLGTNDLSVNVYGYSLAVSPDDILYTVGSDRLTGYNTDLQVVSSYDVTGCNDDSYSGLTIANGNFYLVDSSCQTVAVYSGSGDRLGQWSVAGLRSCFSIAETNAQFFLTSPTERAVRIVSLDGMDVGSIAIPESKDGPLYPVAVAAHNDKIHVLAGDHVLVFTRQTAVELESWSDVKIRFQ